MHPRRQNNNELFYAPEQSILKYFCTLGINLDTALNTLFWNICVPLTYKNYDCLHFPKESMLKSSVIYLWTLEIKLMYKFDNTLNIILKCLCTLNTKAKNNFCTPVIKYSEIFGTLAIKILYHPGHQNNGEISPQDGCGLDLKK